MSKRKSRISVAEKSNLVLKSLSAISLSKSTFTLSFVLEIVKEELPILENACEGEIELETCLQGFKIQYRLSPTVANELDVFVWSKVAKVCCGQTWAWVRTWDFLERRWLAFTIRHSFSMKVLDLLEFVMVAAINPLPAAAVASAKNQSVYVPRTVFGKNKFFAPVLDDYPSMDIWLADMIWNLVESCIPPSDFDGKFDTPLPVSDVRHQDGVLYQIREMISKENSSKSEMSFGSVIEEYKPRDSKVLKGKDKSGKGNDMKIEMTLPGNTLLAGTGRIVPFEMGIIQNPNLGKVVVVASTGSLPAHDDTPIVFINVTKIYDIPVEEFKSRNITEIYTRWRCGEIVHTSEPLRPRKEANINDPYTLPMLPQFASLVIAEFIEKPFEIELRGIRQIISNPQSPKMFGDDPRDKYFDKSVPRRNEELQTDVLIAICRIDVISLSKGKSAIVSGEFSLYPPSKHIAEVGIEDRCTNEINRTRSRIEPELVVPASVILEAHMTMEVAIGYVGCKPPKLERGFLRLYCCIMNNLNAVEIIEKIIFTNEKLQRLDRHEDILTGWIYNTGSGSLMYLEGSSKEVPRVWDFLRNFYPDVCIVFSCKNMYAERMYPEFLNELFPFAVLKLCAPLAALLGCPELYVRPALPNPARLGLMKMGRLAASKTSSMPTPQELPTAAELRSMRLELCQPLLK